MVNSNVTTEMGTSAPVNSYSLQKPVRLVAWDAALLGGGGAFEAVFEELDFECFAQCAGVFVADDADGADFDAVFGFRIDPIGAFVGRPRFGRLPGVGLDDFDGHGGGLRQGWAGGQKRDGG